MTTELAGLDEMGQNIPQEAIEEGNERRDESIPANSLQPEQHAFIENLRRQELGKMLLTITFPVITGIVIYFYNQKSPPAFLYVTVAVLSFGCVAIWNGLMLQGTHPHLAIAAENTGLIIVLLAYFGLVASFLPLKLLWIPFLLGIFTVLPYVLAVLQSPE